MGRRLLLLLAGLGLAACGDDDPGGPDTVLVEGQVISSRSGAPVADASVNIGNLIAGPFVETSTDAEGRFSAMVDVSVCGGVHILVNHPDYTQPAPFPDVCPGTSRVIEVQPAAVSIVIAPQDPSVPVGGTVDFTAHVTYVDGTEDENGAAFWVIAAGPDIGDPLVCGSFPPSVVVQGITYTAPATPPPAECGAAAGQVLVVAYPEAGFGSNVEASDTVIVTVTP